MNTTSKCKSETKRLTDAGEEERKRKDLGTECESKRERSGEDQVVVGGR